MIGPISTRRFVRRVPFFYGWIVVAVAFISMAIGVNARTSFSLLFPPILDEFGWDRATIAATFSIGFVTSTILSPLVGALMDKYGPRLVLPLGATLTALGFLHSDVFNGTLAFLPNPRRSCGRRFTVYKLHRPYGLSPKLV